MKTIATALLLCLAATLGHAQEAITPTAHIELFDGHSFSGFTGYLRSNAPPQNTWSITDGTLHCTGKPNGYLRTIQTYRDFQVTVEWRFSPNPTGTNLTKAVNTGVCVFMQEREPDANPNKIWPHCVECQGMHDHMGDFWLQGGTTAAEPITQGKNGIKMTIPSNESPLGEWTTFTCICRSNTVEIVVNGKSMNKITGVDVSSGGIGLQSEGGPFELRKWYLDPLK